MNLEIQKIKTLITQTANGDNWTGINAQQALENVDFAKAVRRINDMHLNIAEFTAHLTCWNKVISKRLDSENYQPAKEEDFPVINDLTEEKWTELKQGFLESFNLLTAKLETKQDAILDKPIFEGATSAYRNVHGQISHLHYHLGQMVLLKKIL